jgi:UDP-N-acetylmuramyl pentapeptide phosphotransferase/UDP-N-acetylglucosamine-1-phosphate transferase
MSGVWIWMVAAGGASALGTWLIARAADRLGLIDRPTERGMHATPKPRGGGLAFVAVSLLVTWLIVPEVFGDGAARAVAIGSVSIAALGLADDRWQLGAGVRFLLQMLAALFVVTSGVVIGDIGLPDGSAWSLGWVAAPLTLFWIVGLTNAYNFMDGIDGLAGGQAVLTAGLLAAFAYVHEARTIAFWLGTLAMSVLGFLAHNWPPARIFMGDVGSGFLGFTFAASVVLLAQSSGPFAMAAAVASLFPFLLDTSVTLLKRLARREPWHTPHRQHFYQRLVASGWSHQGVTSMYLAAAAACGVAGFVWAL